MDIIYPSVDEILPGLFIGNFATALNKNFIVKNKISLVVNCTPNVPNMFPGIVQYANVPINDIETENESMYIALRCVLSKIRLYLVYGKNVLVHCMAGKSRSCSIVAGYLIRYYNYDVDSAIRTVISKRPKAFDYGRQVVFRKSLDRFYALINYQN